MTHDGMCRRNNDYGESPVPRRNVPIASSLLASRARQRSQLKTVCIGNTRHSLEAPLRVGSGVLASPAKCVPRDPAPAVPRVADASLLQLRASGSREQPKRKVLQSSA